MTARFDVQVKNKEIHCTITVDVSLSAPVLCFSLMAPGEVISGGKPGAALGGHLEVALPDGRVGEQEHAVALLAALGGLREPRAGFRHGSLGLGVLLELDQGPELVLQES